MFKYYFKTKNSISINKNKIDSIKTIDVELSNKVKSELEAGIINMNEARTQLGLSEVEMKANLSTLNGAQVTSLIEVLRGLGGVIPTESARAVINAAFPTIPQEYINQIVDAYNLKPKTNG